MTIQLLPAGEMRELKEAFSRLGYTAAGLQAAFETAAPPKRAGLPRFLYLTRQPEALPVLARIFLAGLAVPVELADRVLPKPLVALCQEAGLTRIERDELLPGVVLVPQDDLLFASDTLDTLGSAQAAGFVLPAGTHAARHLLNLTIRRPVDMALDLGAGCGVQALHAAAYSGHVCATDISPAATRYAEFNARLNGFGNVECVTGDLFSPVAERQFDLIVSNPPFVPGPAGGLVYRDSGRELDGLCRQLVREAPAHLTEGGFFQMLCEWVEIEGESWQKRLAGWLDGLECDCWVLRSPPQAPAAYAALRVSEIAGPVTGGTDLAAWIEYFETHRVRAIHPGLIVLRRRRGRNWIHVQPLSRDVREPAGDAILQNFRSCDFLAERVRADELLDTILKPSPDLRLEQVHRPEDGAWRVEAIRLWLSGALPFDADVDAAAAALLSEFDGSASTGECLERLATKAGEDVAALRRRGMPAVRFFVERGFLLPPEG